MKNACKTSVKKHEGRRSFKRPGHRLDDDIKMGVKWV
jgi:hypothetical protein